MTKVSALKSRGKYQLESCISFAYKKTLIQLCEEEGNGPESFEIEPNNIKPSMDPTNEKGCKEENKVVEETQQSSKNRK